MELSSIQYGVRTTKKLKLPVDNKYQADRVRPNIFHINHTKNQNKPVEIISAKGESTIGVFSSIRVGEISKIKTINRHQIHQVLVIQ